MPSLIATRPAAPFADAKARLAAAVEAARDEILDLSHRIHADPEPAFEEVKAAAWVAEVLAATGSPSSIRPAAWRPRSAPLGAAVGPATARGSASSPSTTRCRASVTAAATTRWPPRASGAAIALAVARRRAARARSCSSGTPAEERGSGKQIMIDDGLFEGLDAALLYHPCDRNHVESHPLASEDVEVVFTGLQSHASSDPWRGKNALDALIMLFISVGLWRQQLPPDGARPRDHPGGRHGRQHHPGPDSRPGS